MYRTMITLTTSALLASSHVSAAPQELSGTWQFSRSVAYFGDAKTVPPPEYPLIQFVDGKLLLLPRCSLPIDYTKTRYSYNQLFQPALKAGVDEKAMDAFTQKHLGFRLSGAREFYQGAQYLEQCNFEHGHVFVLNNKLVLVNGGGIFSSYDRVPPAVAAPSGPNLYGRKLSQLPYNGALFNIVCSSLISRKVGTSEPMDACAPALYPYAATKGDSDPLGKLIGSHQYKKFGAEADADYNNPVSHGLHPIYMLFQPFKDVLVAAVEDIEQGESSNRGGMTGVYLSIKAGKVVDQVTAECLLQPDYSCTDLIGKKVFQLSDTGKFVRVKK